MKHLSPAITCLLTIHKNPLAEEALKSVVSQTRKDAQIIVADSGYWVEFETDEHKKRAELYAKYKDHPMIDWVFTGERENASKSTCMVAKVFNDVFRQDLVRGKYFCTFYEDDLYNPRFFERMAKVLDGHDEYDAVWCSQYWLKKEKDKETLLKVWKADKDLTPKDRFNNVVDGGQIMMRTEAIKRLMKSPYNLLLNESYGELIPESPDTCRHSDGLFFEKFKTVITKVGYIEEPLYTHRFSPESTFTKDSQV